MRKALLLLGLLLLASISEMEAAKNHAYLPSLETPSERSALVLSWRSGSEQFATLHGQLSKDFDKWRATKKMVKTYSIDPTSNYFVNTGSLVWPKILLFWEV